MSFTVRAPTGPLLESERSLPWVAASQKPVSGYAIPCVPLALRKAVRLGNVFPL